MRQDDFLSNFCGSMGIAVEGPQIWDLEHLPVTAHVPHDH